MTTSTTMTHLPLTPTNLAAEGLTADQVSRLSALRKRYNPAREHFSEPEAQRLSFLRWRFARGLVGRG